MKKLKSLLVVLLVFLIIISLSTNFLGHCKDTFNFFAAFFKAPKTIGAVCPSSSYLAKSITGYLRQERREPIKVLEIGAGTGVFTREIVKNLNKDDICDAIEIEPNFCNNLRSEFKDHKNVFIHQLSILDFNPKYKYDFIISGLPFNSFDAGFVQEILDKYIKLTKPNGIISYFEYMLLPNLKRLFLTFNPSEKKKFADVLAVTKDFRKKFLVKKNYVFLNLPPAYVYHLQV